MTDTSWVSQLLSSISKFGGVLPCFPIVKDAVWWFCLFVFLCGVVWLTDRGNAQWWNEAKFFLGHTNLGWKWLFCVTKKIPLPVYLVAVVPWDSVVERPLILFWVKVVLLSHKEANASLSLCLSFFGLCGSFELRFGSGRPLCLFWCFFFFQGTLFWDENGLFWVSKRTMLLVCLSSSVSWDSRLFLISVFHYIACM